MCANVNFMRQAQIYAPIYAPSANTCFPLFHHVALNISPDSLERIM